MLDAHELKFLVWILYTAGIFESLVIRNLG
jgi:hypothetical protein